MVCTDFDLFGFAFLAYLPLARHPVGNGSHSSLCRPRHPHHHLASLRPRRAGAECACCRVHLQPGTGDSPRCSLLPHRAQFGQERPPAIPDRISSLRWPGGCNSCLSQVGRAHKFAWALESIVRADMELGFFQGVKPHERFYENSRNILQLTLLKRHFERGLFDPWSQLFCNEPFC